MLKYFVNELISEVDLREETDYFGIPCLSVRRDLQRTQCKWCDSKDPEQ